MWTKPGVSLIPFLSQRIEGTPLFSTRLRISPTTNLNVSEMFTNISINGRCVLYNPKNKNSTKQQRDLLIDLRPLPPFLCSKTLPSSRNRVACHLRPDCSGKEDLRIFMTSCRMKGIYWFAPSTASTADCIF